MSLDSYARYLLNINQLPVAQKMYEKALQISKDVQGETHPQVMCTVVAGLLGKERLTDLTGKETAVKAALLVLNVHSTELGSAFLPGRIECVAC